MAELILDTERVKLWHGDALDVLPTYKTESFDLVLTDPPYNVAYQSNMRKKKFEKIANDEETAEDRDVVAEVLEQCVRLVGQERHLYVFGPAGAGSPMEGLKVSAGAELIWNKKSMGMGDLSSPWGTTQEKVWFHTSMHRHAGKKGKENLPVRRRRGTVLEFERPKGRTLRHPTEKPVPLLLELLESSSRAGEVVLDPFAGVGSTGVAALLAGRKAVLCELDPAYIEIAAARLKKAEEVWREGLTI